MRVRVLFFVCLLALSLRAQTPEKKRPSIGLVLEGGGALGLAHIGLIQWFERHHIPIDYIAGTSMGGLVGGFYASGMNGIEMHDVVRSLDWDQLVAGEPDYQKLSFRRKQDLRDIADGTVLGLKNKLVLPSGLNSGQGLDLLLSRIALPYAYLPSFADLPTPFRCVAADLTTAKAHVFEDGSFAEALRSTMSIPGLFEPVFDGNHEFVDGSILNNLPVDVVKQMGADIIIAVYLDTTPFDPKEPQSALAVLGRSLSAVTVANERHNMEMADMLISVDLHGIGTLNFAQFEDIIGRGSSGAEKRSRVLSKFALNDEDWQRYEEARASRRKTTFPVPQFVAIRGISGSLADTVQQYFVDLAGQPLQPEQVSDRIHKVMGTGAFSYMGYSMTRRGDENGLLIYVHPSPARPPTLQPALLLDGSDYKNTRFALAARLTAVNLGGFRSEWRTDFVVGSTYSVRSEWYHPWTAQSSWFIAPNAFASTRPLDFYHANQPRSLYRMREQGGGVDVGRMFGDVGELRVGYDSSYVVPSFNLGNVNAYPKTRGRFGDAHIQYTFDRVDDQIIPHSGVLARANLRLVDANPGLTKAAIPVLDGSAEWFRPTSYRGTLFTAIEGGGTLGKTNDGLPLFFLGGPQRLSAYGMNEYVGNNYVLGRVGWLRQLSPLVPVLDSRLYLLADYEVGRMFDARAGQTNTPMDANAGFIIRTVLGPLFLGGSVGDSSHRKIYFEMGRVF